MRTFLDGRVTQNCPVCGVAFTVDASRLRHGRGKHCSPACQYEAIRRSKKRRVSFTCVGCGAGFDIPPSKANRAGGGKYCSRPCRDAHWKGDKTPNWQSGDGVYKRGPNWHSTRRRIIARDVVCQKCGADGDLHVHHNIPFRVFESYEVANSDWNLISLCPPCHRKEDARHKWVNIAGGVLQFEAGGEAWRLARERGLV